MIFLYTDTRLETIILILLINLPTISNQFTDSYHFYWHEFCLYQRGFENVWGGEGEGEGERHRHTTTQALSILH